MLSGIITQLLPARRLGFVRAREGGIPLLFNALSVEGVYFQDLSEGQEVTYTLERDPLGRGARATHVRPITSPPGDAPSSPPGDTPATP